MLRIDLAPSICPSHLSRGSCRPLNSICEHAGSCLPILSDTTLPPGIYMNKQQMPYTRVLIRTKAPFVTLDSKDNADQVTSLGVGIFEALCETLEARSPFSYLRRRQKFNSITPEPMEKVAGFKSSRNINCTQYERQEERDEHVSGQASLGSYKC